MRPLKKFNEEATFHNKDINRYYFRYNLLSQWNELFIVIIKISFSYIKQ